MKALLSAGFALLVSSQALAQQHEHAMPAASKAEPTAGGQYAFATISEIVKLLKADATTDWSK